jgi:hypothetical protein
LVKQQKAGMPEEYEVEFQFIPRLSNGDTTFTRIFSQLPAYRRTELVEYDNQVWSIDKFTKEDIRRYKFVLKRTNDVKVDPRVSRLYK